MRQSRVESLPGGVARPLRSHLRDAIRRCAPHGAAWAKARAWRPVGSHEPRILEDFQVSMNARASRTDYVRKLGNGHGPARQVPKDFSAGCVSHDLNGRPHLPGDPPRGSLVRHDH